MNVQIVGTMLDPSGGEPAGGAMIQFIALAQYGGVPKGAQSTQTASATGEYDFPLNYGRYSLSINHSGRFVNQAVSVTVNDESPSVMDIDLLLQSSVPLTPPEIKYIEELAEQAKQAADDAEGFAGDAAYQVSLAKGEVVKATNQANIATIEADRAKTEADRAAEVTGLDTVEQAVDMALSEVAGLMTESEARAINRINESKYDASGFVNAGKTPSSSAYNQINSGMYTRSNAAIWKNKVAIGRNHSDSIGTSKTNFAVTHLTGAICNLVGAYSLGVGDSLNEFVFELPEAEDGTGVFDSTGNARGSGKASLDLKVDVDPKYGDVAANTNEAVARAFEGEQQYGDFRGGLKADGNREPEGWNYYATGDQTFTLADGVLEVTKGAATPYGLISERLAGNVGDVYEVSFTVHSGEITSVRYSQSFVAHVNIKEIAAEVGEGRHTFRYTLDDTLHCIWFESDADFSLSGVSIKPVTEEVVTHPVDLLGFEYYEEELTERQEVFECIQSTATTFGDTDVSTVLSTRKLSYFQQYDGQFPEVTVDPDFINDRYRCVVWSDLTEPQKREVAAYMGEKLFIGVNGNIKNGRMWATTIRGLGNGDWHNVDSTKGNLEFRSSAPVLSRNGNPYVQDENNKGVFTDGNGCYLYVVATVPRENKGAYVPGLNEFGTAKCSDDKFWYESVNTPTTIAECFIGQVGGGIASGKSGHPDSIFYDGIEAGGLNGVIDWRLGAVANDSPEEAAKVEAKVENGTYRGLEKLVWTKCLQDGVVGSGSHPNAAQKVYVADTDTLVCLQDTVLYPVSIGDTVTVLNSTTGEQHTGKVQSLQSNYFYLTVINHGMTGNWTGATVLEVITTETNLSVSGEFNTQMVIGDPANILLTDALKNGWLGTWCDVIPDGATDSFPLTRECLTTGSLNPIWSEDGVNWVTGSRPLSDALNAITLNDWGVGNVTVLPYKAFAKQTKPSTNKPVYNGNKGLLGITVTQSHSKAVLAEAVAGIILKSDAGGIVTEQSSPVKFLVDEVIERITSLMSDMAAPTNNSQAVKIAVYQVSENGQVNLGFIANTMTHNGTDWGELDEIIIPFGNLEVDTFNDANGIAQIAQSTITAIPMGWASNHARAGEQVPGVDL